jgi:uncharacterized protein (TIGR02300 family)
MTKQELGVKRLCARRGTRFYDLHHSPIICPKCLTVFEIAAMTSRSGSEPARAPIPVSELETPETNEDQFASLEDAEAAEAEEDAVEPGDAGLNGAALIEEIEGDEAEVTGEDGG